MRASWVILAVALYVSLDMANPLMPGALMFGAEDSVEVRQAERFRAHHHAMIVPVAHARERGVVVDLQTCVSRPVVRHPGWTPPPPMQRARSSLAASISSPEDH